MFKVLRWFIATCLLVAGCSFAGVGLAKLFKAPSVAEMMIRGERR